jgi:hypothetical protein
VSTAAPLDLFAHEEAVPRVALLVNPALAPLGKWSARLEVAPLRAHALFVEASRARIDVGDTRVSGSEIDLGYHLFPLDRGLSGFYLGPRYLYAKGESDVARGTASGFGADLGFQWVIGVFALNFGAGVARAKIVIEPKSELASAAGVPDEVKASLPSRVETTQIVPLGTFGVGVSFLTRAQSARS